MKNTSKPTKKEKINLARRFSSEDWGWLCGQYEFLLALEESIEAAEIAAHRLMEARG